MSTSEGWMSRFDIAAQTRHRIVLYGNVLDSVSVERGDGCAETLPFCVWLRGHLEQQFGIRRVVYYNHAERPRVLFWGDAGVETGERELTALFGRTPGDHSEPRLVLPVLGQLLRDSEQRGAVIIDNAEHRIKEPSQEAVLLRQLARPQADGTPVHGIAVHLYTSDSQIPPDFITADSDTAVILVAMPSFSDREAFFKRLPENSPILQARERGAPIAAPRLARITEGYRLRELDQLCALAQGAGEDIQALLSYFRHGRRLDYWADLKVDEVRDKLHARVFGQDDAIDQIVDAVYCAKHHIGSLIDDSVRTPAMVLFFVGPTGVGKTHTARTICEAITGTEENLKRIDMSEYQREHTDQRLIGPPPGYVGHLEGGQLTNWVLERPHSVVLIDEVEKAHERILDIFLQILDGARLTDGKGQTVDLSETILIFTSNIGVAEAMEKKIDPSDRKAVVAHFYDQVLQYFRDDLERPEIFNRLKQGIVVFSNIGEETARPAIEARLRQIAAGVERRLGGAIRIHFDPSAGDDRGVVDALLAATDYSSFGLRDVNSILRSFVGGPLARRLDLLQAQLENGESYETEWRFRWNRTAKSVEVARFAGQ